MRQFVVLKKKKKKKVRDNTLESPETRTQKVLDIIEEFVSDLGQNQLGLPLPVKEKLDDLKAKLGKNVELWDGRPLLMLQRETELMMLADVKDFAENNPWTESDGNSSLGFGRVAVVTTVLPKKLTEAKRVEVLKQATQSVGSRLGALKRRTLTFSRTATKKKTDFTGEIGKVEQIKGEQRFCRLNTENIVIHLAQEETSPVQFDMRLLLLELKVHSETSVLEIAEPGNVKHVFFLKFEEASSLTAWSEAIKTSQARLEKMLSQLREKRQKILSSPLEPPASRVSVMKMDVSPPPVKQKLADSTKREKKEKKLKKKKKLEFRQLKKSGVMEDRPDLPVNSEPSPMDLGYRNPGSMTDMTMLAKYQAATPFAFSSATGYGPVSLGGPASAYGSAMSPRPEDAPTVQRDGSHKLLELSESESGSSSEDESLSRDSSSSSSDLSYEGSSRGDFNEIYQSCVTRLRKLSGGFATTAPTYDKLRMETYVDLIGLAEDFVTSAVRYGQIIISEVYLPPSKKTIRPNESIGGVIGGEKFVVQNILFKFALDIHNVFGGNHDSAAKVAGLELKGLQAYMSTNTPDLCYPLMALIDYKGFRLVASSLLPLTSSSLIYGSQDAGATIKKASPPFTARIEEASAKLNLKLHEAGKDRVVMATAVDIEGHMGRDNRFYLLDFSRVFPPVTPNRNVEGSHLFQMFRPEFVKSFTLFPLCSDAYSRFTIGLPDAKEHTEEVDMATMELLNVSISNFVTELVARMGEEARITGTLENFSLTQLLHAHGINVRYLGEVVRKMGRHPFGLVVFAEMVARVVKFSFRETLRAEMKRLRVCVDEPYRIAVKDFLNNVFSSSEQSDKYWQEEVAQRLNSKFQLRPGNWNAFPRALKKTLFDLERVNGVAFNAKMFIFHRLQQSLGLKVAAPLLTLLQTQPKIYAQTAVFDDVDIEDVGVRVKFLDVISNAQGYVFSKRAEQKEKEGFFEAAKSLYQRAYMGYQAALISCPNDSTLLRNCAVVMTKLYRINRLLEAPEISLSGSAVLSQSMLNSMPSSASIPTVQHPLSTSMKGASLDDPLLYTAQNYLKKAIQADRKSPESFAAYANFLRDLGLYADAEAHYIEALLRDPYDVESLTSYANLLETMSQKDMAEIFANRSREVAKSIDKLNKPAA